MYFCLCNYILLYIIYYYIIIYNHIYIEREKDNKPNRKEVWFDFHIRYRAENIA